VDRAGEVVVQPHAVETGVLGEQGGVADVLPPPAERIEEQVHQHGLIMPWHGTGRERRVGSGA
jgi:hypothetical protein